MPEPEDSAPTSGGDGFEDEPLSDAHSGADDVAAEAGEPGVEPQGAADRDHASRPTANTAADNYGQLVQDAVINGGLHLYGSTVDQAVFRAETRRLMRESRRVDPERVAVIRATFVAPDGYRAFAADFQRCRVGVVSGRSDTGRAATAIHVLDSTALQIQEVVLEAQDGEWHPDRLPAESGHAYLLDATLVGSDLDVLRRRIRQYALRVRTANARLIVIAESWEEDPADGYAILSVSPPDTEAVFLRHLSHFTDGAEARRWASEPEIRKLLSGRTPAYATRLAKQIQRENEPTGRPTGFADRLTAVLDIFRNYEEDVRTWFVQHEKEYARAEERRRAYRTERSSRFQAERREDIESSDYPRVVMGAVAVLEGCPSDAVMVQVDRLAEAWQVTVPMASPVSGGGVRAVLKQVAAEVGSDDRVRFQKSGFGPVVLDYLWSEYPKARYQLLTWSNRAVRDVPAPERRAVARRWLQLAERQGDAGPVKGLLAAWGRDGSLRNSVVEVIARAAVHDKLGPEVRNYLYALARSPGDAELDQAVAQICGHYGTEEPRTALVRLAWLADRAASPTLKAVTHALDAISEEPSCRAIVLRELVGWAADAQARPRAGVARRYLGGMLATLDPDGVPRPAVEAARNEDEFSVALVAEGLAAALTAARPKECAALLDAWIGPLTGHPVPELRTVLEGVLRRAAATHTAANIRIGDRLAVWRHRSAGRALVDFTDRVSTLDPLLGRTA